MSVTSTTTQFLASTALQASIQLERTVQTLRHELNDKLLICAGYCIGEKLISLASGRHYHNDMLSGDEFFKTAVYAHVTCLSLMAAALFIQGVSARALRRSGEGNVLQESLPVA
jgi:hypothetical protein